jgi:hypothetical protein
VSILHFLLVLWSDTRIFDLSFACNGFFALFWILQLAILWILLLQLSVFLSYTKHIKKAKTLIKDAEIQYFDCGHGIHIEKEKDFVNCLINDF